MVIAEGPDLRRLPPHTSDRDGVFLSPIKPECAIAPNEEPPTSITHGTVRLGRDRLKWSLTLPRKLKTDKIAVFVPGLGATKHTTDAFARESAICGMPVLWYQPGRCDKQSASRKLLNPQRIHVDTLHALSEELIANRDLPRNRDIDYSRAILIAHSMGGLAAPIYGLESDGQVGAIINIAAKGYACPAKCLPSLNPVRAIRNLKGLHKAILSGDVTGSLGDIRDDIDHSLSHPFQTISEGISCLVSDIRPQVQRLRESGCPIGYLALELDTLVPPSSETAEIVDSYRVVPHVGHYAPQFQPKKCAEEVRSMYDALAFT